MIHHTFNLRNIKATFHRFDILWDFLHDISQCKFATAEKFVETTDYLSRCHKYGNVSLQNTAERSLGPLVRECRVQLISQCLSLIFFRIAHFKIDSQFVVCLAHKFWIYSPDIESTLQQLSLTLNILYFSFWTPPALWKIPQLKLCCFSAEHAWWSYFFISTNKYNRVNSMATQWTKTVILGPIIHRAVFLHSVARIRQWSRLELENHKPLLVIGLSLGWMMVLVNAVSSFRQWVPFINFSIILFLSVFCTYSKLSQFPWWKSIRCAQNNEYQSRCFVNIET